MKTEYFINETKRKILFQFISAKYVYVGPLALAMSRGCVALSAGVLLLADTIPGLIVSLTAPFLPFYIKYV